MSTIPTPVGLPTELENIRRAYRALPVFTGDNREEFEAARGVVDARFGEIMDRWRTEDRIPHEQWDDYFNSVAELVEMDRTNTNDRIDF